MYSVRQKNPDDLWQFFSKAVGNFSTKFYVPIRRSYLCCRPITDFCNIALYSTIVDVSRSYAISATTLCAFRSMVDILSTSWWSRLIWRNFVKVAGN